MKPLHQAQENLITNAVKNTDMTHEDYPGYVTITKEEGYQILDMFDLVADGLYPHYKYVVDTLYEATKYPMHHVAIGLKEDHCDIYMSPVEEVEI